LLGTAAGRPIEIWFQDEARVGQQGTHAYYGRDLPKVPSGEAGWNGKERDRSVRGR
jgi:hypothetical protein